MKIVKKLFKWILFFLSLPLFYLIAALILSAITVNNNSEYSKKDQRIYLNSNGVHLDIILPKNKIDAALLDGLESNENDKFISFGWGDENFYVNTPTWADLTIKNAFIALFLDSPTLMHVKRYNNVSGNWVEIKINNRQLRKLNKYILNYFKTDDYGNKIILKDFRYSTNDNFYKANGSFSFLNTCNTWVNSAFKKSGLKSCYWTPFDFGLLNKYK